MPVLIVLFILAVPISAGAQAATPRWDAAVVGAGIFGHPDDVANATHFYDDNWYGGGQFGVTAGRYWTTHLKTELELAITSEAHRYVQRFVTVPNLPSPAPVRGEQFLQTREVSLGVTWQFLQNEWVHPYLTGGVALDFDRTRTVMQRQVYYTGDPTRGSQIIPIADSGDGPSTTLRARGLIGMGAKFYMTPKTFFRTEARGAVSPRVEHLAFRAGFGLDF